MANILKTKGIWAGTTVSKAIETFPKHLFVFQYNFISQYRIDITVCPQEVQKPSLLNNTIFLKFLAPSLTLKSKDN